MTSIEQKYMRIYCVHVKNSEADLKLFSREGLENGKSYVYRFMILAVYFRTSLGVNLKNKD